MRQVVKTTVVGLWVLLFAACGGGGGGENTEGPSQPSALSISTASLPNGAIGMAYSRTLTATGGTAPYSWSVQSGGLPAGLGLNGNSISGTPTTLGTSTFTIQVSDSAAQTDTQVLNITIGSSGSQYDPPWAAIAPTQTLTFNYNSLQTPLQNGTALKTALQALTPGQRLDIKAGTYDIGGYFDLTRSGSATAPIWIVGEDGVIFTQSYAQNILNVGAGKPVSYLCIRDIEFTSGDMGVRFYQCANVWLDQCHVHHTGEAGITANTANTSYMYFTRNEVNDTGGTGEGMYLGSHDGTKVMSRSIVALNHIHDTKGGTVSQGDGIELKQGSWGNLIAENLVHDCNYPCILVYGTGGQEQNIVERNTCYNSDDNTIQVQGECIVRNNLIMNGKNAAFASTNHVKPTTNLQVIHNTIINNNNSAQAMNLVSWNGRANMVLANNVVYSQGAVSIRFPSGSSAVTVAGNVVAGTVSGVASGYMTTANAANPLADFTNVTWDAAARNALPVLGSTIIGAGNAIHAVPIDITGATRASGLESGCYDRP